MSVLVFWVIMPFGYQRFGGTYCLYLQKTNFDIFTAVRTSTLIEIIIVSFVMFSVYQHMLVT
jgi:hypothetical protein